MPLTAYDNQVLALSPSGYWKLDEASGLSFADSSGFAHPLVAGAGAVERWRIPGPSTDNIPVACDFLSVNPPACATPTVGSFAAGVSFTAECWIGSVGAFATNTGFVTKGYNVGEVRPWWSLGARASGAPFFWFRNGAGTDYTLDGYGNVSDASYPQRGPYHHIMGVYDAAAAMAYLYVDGVLQNSMAVPNTGWGTGAQGLVLGTLAAAVWGGPWVADVALYPSALSQSQAAANFNSGLSQSIFYFWQLAADIAAILAAIRRVYKNAP